MRHSDRGKSGQFQRQRATAAKHYDVCVTVALFVVVVALMAGAWLLGNPTPQP